MMKAKNSNLEIIGYFLGVVIPVICATLLFTAYWYFYFIFFNNGLESVSYFSYVLLLVAFVNVMFAILQWESWRTMSLGLFTGAVIIIVSYTLNSSFVDIGKKNRIQTIEIAFLDHAAVSEVAVVIYLNQSKKQQASAFIVLKERKLPGPDLEKELKNFISERYGNFGNLDRLIFISEIPKTADGKIMVNLLRDIAQKQIAVDNISLTDPSVIKKLKRNY